MKTQEHLDRVMDGIRDLHHDTMDALRGHNPTLNESIAVDHRKTRIDPETVCEAGMGPHKLFDHQVQDQARPASCNQGLALDSELSRLKSWVRELRCEVKALKIDLLDAEADVEYFKGELETFHNVKIDDGGLSGGGPIADDDEGLSNLERRIKYRGY